MSPQTVTSACVSFSVPLLFLFDDVGIGPEEWQGGKKIFEVVSSVTLGARFSALLQ